MRLCRSVSRALLAALFVALAAGHATAQVGRVGGVVKDEGGQPLKGATVTAENANIAQSFTATTDDKGRFTMIGLRAGDWRFIAQAPGFTPEAGSMPVRMGTPNPPVTFMLKKGGVANYGPLGGVTGKDLQEALEQADTAFSQQRWDEAIETYRSILSRSSALAVVNLQLAAASRGKGDHDSALAAYTALLKGDPDNSKAHVGIADTYIEKGEAQTAEEGLVRAAQSPATGREVFFTLGEMSFTRNDTLEAARWYKKATSVDPFWGKPLYKLGLCAMKSGDADGAAILMARVIAVDPISPEAALAQASLESLKK